MRLDKPKSRERWRQIRALWNDFDPIGVVHAPFPGRPDDEYDSYLGPTLRLLERGAPLEDLQRYLAEVTLEHMGLGDSPRFQQERQVFAQRLKLWYETEWPDTHV